MALEDMGSMSKSSVNVADLLHKMGRNILWGIDMHKRRTSRYSILQMNGTYDWQWLIFDINKFERILSNIAVRGDHHRHCLANVAYYVFGQCILCMGMSQCRMGDQQW